MAERIRPAPVYGSITYRISGLRMESAQLGGGQVQPRRFPTQAHRKDTLHLECRFGDNVYEPFCNSCQQRAEANTMPQPEHDLIKCYAVILSATSVWREAPRK